MKNQIQTSVGRLRGLLGVVVVIFSIHSASTRAVAEDFAKNYGFKFKAGIGFYVVIDGVAHPLGWLKNTKGKANDADIWQIPFDAQFYSYGLDFSSGGMPAPLPPHLLGYGFSYLDTNDKREGLWPARFVPVAGYEEKVYRIIFEGPYDELRNDKISYLFWAFQVEVPGEKNGFLFHFETAKFAEEQKKLRAFVSQVLSSKDKSYSGKLSAKTFFSDSKTTPFQIRFTSYDEKTGKVQAEASGLNEKERIRFDGQLIGIRQLTLKQAGSQTVWDLQLTGQKNLIGGYSENITTVEIEIVLEDAPPK